jgi:nifR3 family TIM-barrel protein
MGCPVRKVCRVGGGSAMMTDQAATSRLVAAMVAAVKVPVTAKMRLGWDDANITAPDLARTLEDAGVSAVFVHGRTREQGFGGRVKLEGIRAVVQAVHSIPVIGNGDVTTPEAARMMILETGCTGVGIGRGAFYDPWIFRATDHFLRTGERLPDEPFSERLRVMRRHLELMVQTFGEEHGCRMFRKIAPWYSRRFGPANEFNKHAVQIRSRAEFEEVVDHYSQWRRQFLDEHGELKERFRPPPLVASFMRPLTSQDGQGASLPVPRGAVELW